MFANCRCCCSFSFLFLFCFFEALGVFVYTHWIILIECKAYKRKIICILILNWHRLRLQQRLQYWCEWWTGIYFDISIKPIDPRIIIWHLEKWKQWCSPSRTSLSHTHESISNVSVFNSFYRSIFAVWYLFFSNEICKTQKARFILVCTQIGKQSTISMKRNEKKEERNRMGLKRKHKSVQMRYTKCLSLMLCRVLSFVLRVLIRVCRCGAVCFRCHFCFVICSSCYVYVCCFFTHSGISEIACMLKEWANVKNWTTVQIMQHERIDTWMYMSIVKQVNLCLSASEQ